MRTLKVGSVLLGEGMPKICVPVTGRTQAEILSGARRAVEARADICEWRADFFEALRDEGAVAQMIAQLRGTLGGIPLLFTIRTRAEGGQAEWRAEDSCRLNVCAAQSGADWVDVEIFNDRAAECIGRIHAAGVPVIASSHDFAKTPDDGEMARRVARMWADGADAAKIAVMPQSAQDVLRLLAFTLRAAQEAPGPVISMAMGKLGAISRLSGETLGSAMTFGSAGAGSAPGQMDAGTLRAALEALHGA